MIKKLKEVCDFYTGTGFPIKYQGKTEGIFPFYKVGDIANNVMSGNIYLSHCNNYISLDDIKEIKELMEKLWHTHESMLSDQRLVSR